MSKNSLLRDFSGKQFVLSMIIRIFCIFLTSVLAKPLNNAQIVRGVFCLYTFEYGESYPPLQNGLNLQKIVQWINTGGLKQKT